MQYFFVFLFCGVLLYFPILSAGFAGDDYSQLVHQPLLHNAQNSLTVLDKVLVFPNGHTILFGYFYRPLPFLLYTLGYAAGNGNPFVLHLIQLLLYLGATTCLFLFYKTFFSQKLAFLLASIFLIHPANNELVAYIAALPDTLCLFFGLLALFIVSITKQPTFLKKLLVSIFLLFALFAKETGMLFVVLVGLYALYKKCAKQYIFPLFISIGVYLACRIHASYHPLLTILPSPALDYAIARRIMFSLQIASAFLREIIVPTRTALKPHAFEPTIAAILLALAILFLFSACCVILWLWIKNYHSKNMTLFLFFLSWVGVGILFFVQIIPLEMIFAQRWLYLAEIGLLGIFGTVVASLAPLPKSPLITICTILFGFLLLSYTIETIILTTMWTHWQNYFNLK
ncbi:MAG TPA: hypothetical protein VE090_03530 [Methylomirabilota bacterium]|nr:hypothetical protein [Methylomirabilota bacterium]